MIFGVIIFNRWMQVFFSKKLSLNKSFMKIFKMQLKEKLV